MASDYAVLTDLAEYMKNVPTTGTDGTVMTHMITRASRFIDRYTGTFFYQNVGSVLLMDGNGMDFITSPWPIVSVSLLEQQYYTGGTWQTVAAGQYFLYPSPPQDGFPYTSIQLTNIPTQGQATEFWAGRQNVRITGTWGWPAIPDEIKHLTLKFTVRMWRARDGGFSGMAGAGEFGTIHLGQHIDSEDIEILDSFKRPSITPTGLW